MNHGFFSTILSTHHYAQPFTCPCHNPQHNLSTGQKIAAFAIAIIAAIPTYGIGAIPAFYIACAAFKSRNAVWVQHVNIAPTVYNTSWYWTAPAWWGFGRVAVSAYVPAPRGHVHVGQRVAAVPYSISAPRGRPQAMQSFPSRNLHTAGVPARGLPAHQGHPLHTRQQVAPTSFNVGTTARSDQSRQVPGDGRRR